MAIKTWMCFASLFVLIILIDNVTCWNLIDKILGNEREQYTDGLNRREKALFDQVWNEEFQYRLTHFWPDSLLTACFVLVVSYIFYMIVAIFLKPQITEKAIDDPAVKALLQDHEFSDNLVPSKIKDLYQLGEPIYADTSIEKAPLPAGDLDTGEVKVNGHGDNRGEISQTSTENTSQSVTDNQKTVTL